MSQSVAEIRVDESVKRPTPKSVETRKSVIDATISCFIEIGYFRTTTTEIAKRANLTRGAVQYYFPTTADVLRASIDHLIEGGVVVERIDDGDDFLNNLKLRLGYGITGQQDGGERHGERPQPPGQRSKRRIGGGLVMSNIRNKSHPASQTGPVVGSTPKKTIGNDSRTDLACQVTFGLDISIFLIINISFAAKHDAAETASLAINVFRCGIDDSVRPELQRALEQRRRKDIVDHKACTGRPGNLGNGSDINQLKGRV